MTGSAPRGAGGAAPAAGGGGTRRKHWTLALRQAGGGGRWGEEIRFGGPRIGWSPWKICTEVSPGCDHCYARELAKRYGWGAWGKGQPRLRTSAAYWRQPLVWDRKAAAAGVRRRVFPSLCDPFDAEAPDEWRADM